MSDADIEKKKRTTLFVKFNKMATLYQLLGQEIMELKAIIEILMPEQE